MSKFPHYPDIDDDVFVYIWVGSIYTSKEEKVYYKSTLAKNVDYTEWMDRAKEICRKFGFKYLNRLNSKSKQSGGAVFGGSREKLNESIIIRKFNEMNP